MLNSNGNLDSETVLRAFCKAQPDFLSAYAILYASSRCVMRLVKPAGNVEGPNGCESIADAYEIRVFNELAELRWVGAYGGLPARAAVLTENEAVATALENGGWTRSSREYIESLPNAYLLWGKRDDSSKREGWTRLVEQQVGAIDVPFANTTKHIRITTMEYVGEHKYGNAAVFEERLLGFESYQGFEKELGR